jgi:hypothetical protein
MTKQNVMCALVENYVTIKRNGVLINAHGRILRPLCSVNEAYYKRPCTI